MSDMWKEICQQPNTLRNCHAANMHVIKQLAEKILTAGVDKIIIAARGTSDHAAVYGKYLLELLVGIPVSLASSSVFTIYRQKLRLKNALVIGISQSGKAADVLEVIRCANESGTITVGISNFEDSPLAQEVHYHLPCSAGREFSVAATKTFTAEIYLLALLASEWAKDRELYKVLESVPAGIAQTLETAGEIEKLVPRYRFMNECFVLARGINYAVSLEAALKIQETNYVRAKAFATSDFQHGPIAMLDPDIPVIAYAPEGPSLPDMKEMLERLAENNIDTLVVSNNVSVAGMGICSLSIPQTGNDMISSFYNAVIAQMFACKLAGIKGHDPDHPRGLNKVTITR